MSATTHCATPGMVRMEAAGEQIPRFLFGQNLEHTRGCIFHGLSAQLVRNRKFAGKPSRNGVAAEWDSWGEKMFFEMIPEFHYTRRESSESGKMPRRNEFNCQCIQNLDGKSSGGILQRQLPLCGGKQYALRLALRNGNEGTCPVMISIIAGGETLLDERVENGPADWRIHLFRFRAPADMDAELRIGIGCVNSLQVGMASLLPEDNFHGMRRDVVEHLKSIGTSLLRWPGGNFAGEYHWRDGLLDPDRRGPRQSFMEIETQPFSSGYDDNEFGTDEIVALCREIGAEPFLTINPVWYSPEESAAWIEYCNGSADTPMGKLRAERGFPEPYRVRFWSLGNEMGFGHMEGPGTPAQYAELGMRHSQALLAVDPAITIFSSGAYPSAIWCRESAIALESVAPLVSLHHYCCPGPLNFTTPEQLRKTYHNIIDKVREYAEFADRMREDLPRSLTISLDEWNVWYAWYRDPGAAEGMFAARFFHWLLGAYREQGIGCACYFQAVNEGAIMVRPRSSHLTATGQIMRVMARHINGVPCREWNSPERFVTRHEGGTLYLTLLNDSDTLARDFELPCGGTVRDAGLLCAPDIYPGSRFADSTPELRETNGKIRFPLPPLSVLALHLQEA